MLEITQPIFPLVGAIACVTSLPGLSAFTFSPLWVVGVVCMAIGAVGSLILGGLFPGLNGLRRTEKNKFDYSIRDNRKLTIELHGREAIEAFFEFLTYRRNVGQKTDAERPGRVNGKPAMKDITPKAAKPSLPVKMGAAKKTSGKR